MVTQISIIWLNLAALINSSHWSGRSNLSNRWMLGPTYFARTARIRVPKELSFWEFTQLTRVNNGDGLWTGLLDPPWNGIMVLVSTGSINIHNIRRSSTLWVTPGRSSVRPRSSISSSRAVRSKFPGTTQRDWTAGTEPERSNIRFEG